MRSAPRYLVAIVLCLSCTRMRVELGFAAGPIPKEFNAMQETASDSQKDVLSRRELFRLNAYWRAANYLSVGQIYLLDNALLREPLKPEDIKPRLLGHWGRPPGLIFFFLHFNRAIRPHDLNVF